MAEVIAVTGRSRRRAYELLRDARTEGEGGAMTRRRCLDCQDSRHCRQRG